MHKLQRLSPCCVHTPLLPVPAVQLLFLPTHPTYGAGDVGYPLCLLVPIPHPQRGKEGIPSMPPSLPSCLGLPPRDRRRWQCWQGAVQDESTHRAGSGWWQSLCWARSRRQSNRCKAGTASGGCLYFGLGHFQSLAVLRVTQSLARSPVALHIPFLSMNEWSNLAGGHCKTQ